MKKPIEKFKTDSEAEEFVANADLTDYNLSGGQIVRFRDAAEGQSGEPEAAREAAGCSPRSG
jgi:hypothetical protein